MAIRNNAPSHDDDSTRSDRTLLLQTNVDTYSGDLGIAGVLLTWAQGCHTGWQDAMTAATGESGQTEEASQEFRLKYDECHNYYQRAKNMLLSIIYQYQKPDEIVEAYEIDGSTPRNRGDLETAIDNIVRQHDIFIADADPRVLPQTIVDQMVVLKDEMAVKWTFVKQERIESRDAFDDKQELFNDDSLKLSLIYDMACMIWGPDDNRLINLGFLPRSMVWTEDKPPYPTNFAHDGAQFTWDVVEGVDSYEVDYRLTGDSGDWTQLYKGAENFTNKKPPDPGEYDFRIRSWADDDSGAWSGVLLVNFLNGGVLPAPTGFIFDDKKQEFSWDFMQAALLYELEISRDEGQTWAQKYFDVRTYFNAGHLDTGKALARVRALDGYQEPGEWTAPPLEVTFVLLAPAFLAYSQYKNEFICNWVPLATGYEFEILDDPSATWEPLYNGPNNHFVYDLKFGDWKIRVRALRNQEFSAWTPAIVVNIIFKAPTGLLYDPSALKIKWDKVPDAAQYHLINETGTISYIGADNHLAIELTGQENFRVRAGDDTMLVWGEWTDWTMLG